MKITRRLFLKNLSYLSLSFVWFPKWQKLFPSQAEEAQSYGMGLYGQGVYGGKLQDPTSGLDKKIYLPFISINTNQSD